MPNATDQNGRLQELQNCYLQIGDFTLRFNNLPDLGDSKSASYSDEPVIGRTAPIKTFANGDNRSISCSINLFVQNQQDCKNNIAILRQIQSAVYPRTGAGAPYYPPVICRLKCGDLLSSTLYPNGICCVMKDYNVKFPTDVPWDAETMCPYRMEISMTFEQVWAGSNLPNQDLILGDRPVGATI